MNVNDANLSMDLRSLDQLKHSSKTDRQALKETAKQLESLFMQELMKSMRASTLDSGMLDNGATEMGTSMLDTQMATKMSGMPGGLSEMILKQLERQIGQQIEQQGLQANTSASTSAAAPAASMSNASGKVSSTSEAFVQKHLAAAQSAEASSGIPAAHILGQAALESGWGKREIKMPDGSSSHNLFGIKAGAGWHGKVAEITTTEYSNGVAHKVTAKFRAYESYEAAFKDHSRLLTQSPRYRNTVAKADNAQDFAQGLQRAGYATDPAYAHKLTQVINTALRVQQATG